MFHYNNSMLHVSGTNRDRSFRRKYGAISSVRC